MGTRDVPLPEWLQHKTPSDVAEFQTSRRVGQKYATVGEVYDAEKQVVVIGLLQLLLKESRTVRKKVDQPDSLALHSKWFKQWHTTITRLGKNHAQQVKRLERMFGSPVKCDDTLNTFDVHEASECYCRGDRDNHWRSVNRLKNKIARLRSVKNPDDIQNLMGIGKKTARKLLLQELLLQAEADND